MPHVLGVIVLACALPRTAMASVSSVYLQMFNLTDKILTDPSSVGGDHSSPNGVVVSGSANFANGMSLNLASIPARGVDARAYLDDYLTFHIAGGGSAQVNASIAGTWHGTFDYSVNADFKVGFALGLGSKLYQGYGYSNPNYNDGIPASLAFTANRDGGSVIGSYSFSAPWTVFDGQQVNLFASVRADASNGASAHIDDPLLIALPAGVTFTSLSGSTYAAPVPEPTTLLLFAAVVAAVAPRRRRPTPHV
jgi:hypothetical protein